MVNLGKICRFPLAQGILEYKVSPSIDLDSARIACYHIENSPNPRSIDISKYRSRKFTKRILKSLAIYMTDKSNYDHVLESADSQYKKDKLKFIRPFDNEIADPYYTDYEAFVNFFYSWIIYVNKLLRI